MYDIVIRKLTIGWYIHSIFFDLKAINKDNKTGMTIVKLINIIKNNLNIFFVLKLKVL